MTPHSWFRFPFRGTPTRQNWQHRCLLHLERLEDRLCLATWSEPVNLGPVINSPSNDRHPAISPDGLSLYISSDRPGGYGGLDIWVSHRASLDDPWEAPVNLGPVINTDRDDFTPTFSPNGRKMYLCSGRPEGYGDNDIWVSSRRDPSPDCAP